MMHAGFSGISMFLWMIFQWGLLLLGIYLIIRWVKKDQGKDGRSVDHAVRIVRERYARGEISEEEYERMLERLEKNG